MNQRSEYEGQIAGAVLKGIILSLNNVNILSRDDAAKLSGSIDTSAWYPMGRCFDIFDSLKLTGHDTGAILFRAGSNFIDEWYHKGPGKELITCGIDFLEYQTGETGYVSVVRGEKEKVGWTKLERIDNEHNLGVLESVNPFPLEFERGVWIAGVMAPGDMEWVDVEIEETPLGRLYQRQITVHFHKKPEPTLEKNLVDLIEHPEKSADISHAMGEALLWKYRWLKVACERDQQFWDASQRIFNSALDRLADLTSELERLASTDPLTGLYNRREIFKQGEYEISLFGRIRLPLSAVMVDIDHFKRINDEYGHLLGDEVIRRVAETLRSGTRNTDHVGRLGGEEFLLLLPNTAESGVYTLAEELRKRVEALEILQEGIQVRVTISLGCATTNRCIPFDQLVAGADAALYESKASGRNRTTRHKAAEPE